MTEKSNVQVITECNGEMELNEIQKKNIYLKYLIMYSIMNFGKRSGKIIVKEKRKRPGKRKIPEDGATTVA